MTPLAREIARTLDALGCPAYRFETGSNHDRVYLTCRDGAERFYVLAHSPSDHRALRNCVAGVRKLYGRAPRAASAKPARVKRRRASAAPLRCPRLTVRPDPFAVLEKLKQQEP